MKKTWSRNSRVRLPLRLKLKIIPSNPFCPVSPPLIPPSRLLVSFIVTARTKKAAFLADTQSQQPALMFLYDNDNYQWQRHGRHNSTHNCDNYTAEITPTATERSQHNDVKDTFEYRKTVLSLVHPRKAERIPDQKVPEEGWFTKKHYGQNLVTLST